MSEILLRNVKFEQSSNEIAAAVGGFHFLEFETIGKKEIISSFDILRQMIYNFYIFKGVIL